MKRFYFAGHSNFANRGCEALVRGTAEMINAQFGVVEILVPSYAPEVDARQWPEYRDLGVRFVRAPDIPKDIVWWNRAARLAPALKDYWLPSYRVPADIEREIDSVDAIVMIGGDVITLDYGLVSLLWHVGLADHFRRKGKSVMLWAASTGPFSAEPAIERFMVKFFRSLSAVSVRETITLGYLQSIGITENVSLVADPAFVLKPQAIELEFMPAQTSGGVLGLNVSPLIAKFRPMGEARSVLQREVAKFIDSVLAQSTMSVVLVPHVDTIDGLVESNNSDSVYMGEVLELVTGPRDRVVLAPRKLNAAQTKYLLAACRFFIGARTHSTIGALGMLVPTVSIAYSVKARGLNLDLFGDDRFVLDTPKVSCETLEASLKLLLSTESETRALLAEKIPAVKKLANESAEILNRAMLEGAVAP